MKLKKLTTAIVLATLPATGVFAAAMDRSGQSVSAFLQPGNYVEAGISVLDPTVSGTSSTALGGQATGDMANDYYFPTAALKLQLTDNISFGLLYDQPFGAEADYTSQSTAFNPTGADGTAAKVKTENLTFLFGFQPNENWNIYAGPVYQTAKGNVSLRGTAYSLLSGYDADMKKDSELGWAAGLAFQIPDIALKASLTYRSEIKHELSTNENVGVNSVRNATVGGLVAASGGAINLATANAMVPTFTDGKTGVTTPQSVNLDFQTGVMANTVAFANVRWVNWDGFAIRPNDFGQALDALGQVIPSLKGGNLVEYKKDQWSATAGVGRKFTEKWAGNVSVGWDSGAGNPVTTFGPTEGYWNLGLGVQYSPTPATFIAGGVKYFWLGDAKGQSGSQFNTPGYVADFKNNDAIAYGLKMGYKF